MSSKLNPQFDFLKAGISQQAIREERVPEPVEAEPSTVEITKENALNILKAVKIDLSKEVPPPPVCLEVCKGYSTATWGTFGNFSMITGKAKTKKTFLIGIAVAAAVCNRQVLNIRGNFPPEKNTVLYFDTEQGEYHVHKAIKRLCKLSGIEIPENLHAYHLRKFKSAERLTMIREAVYSTPNLGLVIIDGIRDLITSINDEEQATEITSHFLKWTDEKQIHIITVLHQNKGDGNARGHVGTEMINKAETVFSVALDGDNKKVSIVEAAQSRDKAPEPFAFEIDETGLPCMVEGWSGKREQNKTAKITVPQDIPAETHKLFLSQIFSKSPQLKYNELKALIKLKLTDYGKPIGDSKAGDFLAYYEREGYIQKHGKDRSPKAYYTNATPPQDTVIDNSTEDLF